MMMQRRILPTLATLRTTAALQARLLHVHCLHGSQSGTAAFLCDQLADDLAARHVDASSRDQRGVGPEFFDSLASDDVVVFLNSCFGQGEPTDSAKALVGFLNSDAAASRLRGKRFAVFGLGSSRSHAPHYQVVGRRLDKRLGDLGAERVLERGEGDDSGDIEDDFHAWEQRLFEVLDALRANRSSSGTSSDPNPAGSAASSGGVPPMTGAPLASVDAAPRPAQLAHVFHYDTVAEAIGLGAHGTVSSYRTVTPPGSPRPCSELRIRPLTGDSSESTTYSIGDHLVVMPNSRAQAWTLARMLGVEEDAAMVSALQGIEYSAPVPPRALRILAAAATDSAEAKHLALVSERGDGGGYKEYARGDTMRGLLDVAREHPSLRGCRLDVDALVDAMPALKTRSYSIASSPSAWGNEVHIAFRQVMFRDSAGGPQPGVCSSWLNTLRPGDRMRYTIRHADFKLPADRRRPVVMVAGGIGIAPFKGFLEERTVAVRRGESLGPALLVRCARSAVDTLYDDLVADSLALGALTDSWLVLDERGCSDAVQSKSRVLEGTRVHTALWMPAQSERVRELYGAGASFYVCGGATGFGFATSAAVEGALDAGMRTSAVVDKGAPPGGHVSGLLRTGRWFEDLAD